MVAVATAGLEDLLGHFLPQQRTWCKCRRTWAMVRQGIVVRSWKDYIMGANCRVFWNMAFRAPRQKSNRFMVMGFLLSASPRDHARCLGHSTCLLLQPPGRQTRTQADKIFAKLRRALPKPEKRATRHNSWTIEGDVETCQKESLCKAVTRVGLDEVKTSGTDD